MISNYCPLWQGRENFPISGILVIGHGREICEDLDLLLSAGVWRWGDAESSNQTL